MRQEELRKGLRRIEKDERPIFGVHSKYMKVKPCYATYVVDEQAAETEWKRLRAALADPVGKISAELCGRNIYYDEQIAVYHKINHIFLNLAETQMNHFHAELKTGWEGAGVLDAVMWEADRILQETQESADELLQTFQVNEAAKKEMFARYRTNLALDNEREIAFPFKRFECEFLRFYKLYPAKAYVNMKGRTKFEVINVFPSWLGAMNDNEEQARFCNQFFSKINWEDRYATFIFSQTINLGKYVVELLLQEGKIPEITHEYDVRLIYEVYLKRFLAGDLSDDEFSEVLWAIVGESLDDEMVLSGILNFETFHDRELSDSLRKWSAQNALYVPDNSRNSVFFRRNMKDEEFADKYEAAFYGAQNEIETQYYMERYRSCLLNRKAGETEGERLKKNYICREYREHIDSGLSKLDAVEKQVCEEYREIEALKVQTDTCIKKQCWSEAVALIDGRFGYVECALFAAVEEKFQYKNGVINSHKVSDIGELLSEAGNILYEIDCAADAAISKTQQDPLKVMTLNVFKAACHYRFIQAEHLALNMRDEQVRGAKEEINQYRRWRTDYKANREPGAYQMMRQCEALILQGANKGVALACVFLLEKQIPNNADRQQRRMMYKVTSQKNCPAQIFEMGEHMETSAKDLSKAYYWYIKSRYLSAGEKRKVEEAIARVQMKFINNMLAEAK